MYPEYSLQDVIRCELCETPVPQLNCDICNINICKTCVGEHLLDESILHIVVPIKHRQSIPKCSYPKCQIHTTKLCELHCEQCDIPVCVQCVSSKKHKAHDVVDTLKFLESKNKALQEDLEELGKIIYPRYQDIATSFSVQKADLQRNTEKLKAALDKRAEEWHKEIENIIRKLKTDIEKTEFEHLAFLKKQEDEINQSISEITHNIGELKKLKDSNDASLLSKYKTRNAEFRRVPPKLIVLLPSFTFQRIDKEQLVIQFGSLSALSRTTEERLYPMKFHEANSCPFDLQQIDSRFRDRYVPILSKTLVGVFYGSLGVYTCFVKTY